MPDRNATLDDRLRAVERAVTDDEVAVADLEDAAAVTARLDAVDERLDRLESRLDGLDAAVTAVRGYVGHLDHVNGEVERTAAAALAAVERIDDASGRPPALARVSDDGGDGHEPFRDGSEPGDGDGDEPETPGLLDRLLARL